MNESSNSSVTNFQTLVHSERVARLPVGVLLLVFYAIGVIGNSHVIHIFRSLPRRKTPSEAIILVLAMFDILTNLVFIFKEYNRMRFVLVDANEFICKLSNFSGFSAGLASSLFVLVLALYRYRRLFTPNTKETTVLFTVIKLVICSLLAAVLSVPVLFIIGHQNFHIGAFTVKRCWVDEEQLYEELPTIYFFLLLCISVFVSVITGLCNIRIIYALRNSKLNLARKWNVDDKTITHIELNAETVIERADFDSRIEATQPSLHELPKANDAGTIEPFIQNKPPNTNGDCAVQHATPMEPPNTDDKCATQQIPLNESQISCNGPKQQDSLNKAPNPGDDGANQQDTPPEQQPKMNGETIQQATSNELEPQRTNIEGVKQQATQIEPSNTSDNGAAHLNTRNIKDEASTTKGGSPYKDGQEHENNAQMPYTRNGKKNEEAELQKSITFTITILIISFTIMLSYMLFLGLFLFVILKRKEPGFAVVSIQEDTFYSYATDIVSLNAVVNPFVYFFSDPIYRKYVKSIYIRKRKRFEGSFRLISY